MLLVTTTTGCLVTPKAWPLKPHSDVLDAIFESDKMRALASFQDLYVGLEPYRNDNQLFGGVLQSTAPAVFGLLAAIELHPTNPLAGGRSMHLLTFFHSSDECMFLNMFLSLN